MQIYIYKVSNDQEKNPFHLKLGPSLLRGSRVIKSANLTVQSIDKKQMQNAFDFGEVPLCLCLISGVSAKENLPVHSPIVPLSQCPPAPIQLAAEAKLSLTSTSHVFETFCGIRGEN